MGAIEVIGDDWISNEFFAPAATDLVSGLMGEYRRARGWIDEAAAFFEGEPFKAVIGYFLDGNSDERRGRGMLASSAAQMFGKEGAVAALDAAYWAKAMALTDIYDAMPQKRREEWNEAIRQHKTPAFEEETVRATLETMLNLWLNCEHEHRPIHSEQRDRASTWDFPAGDSQVDGGSCGARARCCSRY